VAGYCEGKEKNQGEDETERRSTTHWESTYLPTLVSGSKLQAGKLSFLAQFYELIGKTELYLA
jgi:hypothetical protein